MNKEMEIIKEILEEMEKLLTGGWCQHKSATDGKGKSTSPYGGNAVCFCLSGALARAAAEIDNFGEFVITSFKINSLFLAFLGEVRLLRLTTIIEYNDAEGRTKEEVVKLVRETREWLLAKNG